VFNHSKKKSSGKKHQNHANHQEKSSKQSKTHMHIPNQKSIADLNSPRYSSQLINKCNLTNIKEFSHIKTRLEIIEERISTL
jgi:hypothetical protein